MPSPTLRRCVYCLAFIERAEATCPTCAHCPWCCRCVALVDTSEIRIRKPTPEVRGWKTCCLECRGELRVTHGGSMTEDRMAAWAKSWVGAHRCKGRPGAT